MAWLALILAAFGSPQKLVDQEPLGVFDREFVLYQQGENVILCHQMENLLLLLDRDWRPIARFDQVGPGPGELDRPVIFGVNASSCLLLNRFNTLLELDPSLRPTGRNYPSIQGFDVVRGVGREGDSFTLVGKGTGDYLVWEVHLRDGQWVTGPGLFPKKKKSALFNDRHYQYHGDCFFLIESPFKDYQPGEPMEKLANPERYEVEVHHLGKGLTDEVVQVLSHRIDAMPEFQSHIMFLGAAFVNRGRYYLHLVFIHLPQADQVGYVDNFSQDGRFLARKAVGPHRWYLTIRGSDRVVVLDSDTMVLYAFDPEP